MVSIRCGDRLFDDVRAVLFDKDGTLANTGNFLVGLGRRRARLIDARIPGVQEPLLMAMGILDDGIDPAGLMAVGSRWETSVAAAAYVSETGRGWREALAIVHTSFAEADATWSDKAAHTPLFGDAVPCLRRLCEAGLRLGIASADTTDNVEQFVEHYALATYFDLMLGSDRQRAKPEKEFLLWACDALAVAPQQMLIVGDSQADVDLARQAETAGCVLIDRGSGDPKARADAHAVASVLTALQLQISP
ncbi:MAG: HAD family hydrolase [Elainellaceae cyanobacterium]